MYVGQPIKRREDYRLLTGRGRYVDDVKASDVTHAAFLRSPHAHARIRAVRTDRARALPGVLAVVTAADWEKAGLGEFPLWAKIPSADGVDRPHLTRPVLCRDEVCFVGDTVAMAVAETRAQALDAIEAIDVDYELLPSSTEVRRTLEPGAPRVHAHLPDNLCFVTEMGEKAAIDAIIAKAPHVVEIELVNNRVTANSIEPRTLLGHYDAGDDRYTLWASHQSPHMLRLSLAENSLRHPEHKIRVVAPDVGGGFGMKLPDYSEEPLVLWGSKLVGRPVRWAATRSEGLLSDAGARDHFSRARLALDADGRFLALSVDTVACLGAYVTHRGASIPGYFYGAAFSSLYTTPAIFCRVRGVYTNTSPVHAYRGAGRPEAFTVLERLIDLAARKLGLDPIALREKNLIPSDRFPYRSPTGLTYDTSDPPALLAKLKALANYDALRAEQKRLREKNVFLGIGMTSFVDVMGAPSEKAGAIYTRSSGFDSATVRVHPTGKVTVFSGSHSHGQGHATTFAQVVATRLDVPIDDVEVVEGDTDRVTFGHGAYASRSTLTTGMAVVRGADRIVEKCRKIAAHLLECAEADLVRENGDFVIKGTDRRVTFTDVVKTAYRGHKFPAGVELGLEEVVFFDPVAPTCASGMHMAVVLIDPETGRVTLRDYFVVDDCGAIINPMVVEGQVHGGLGQGIGQALMEEVAIDHGTGQVLAGSFMDYAMPRAGDLPMFSLGRHETVSPTNALGIKSAGESGTIGAVPALANAVADALSHLGVRHVELPATPAKVWAAIAAARG
ncbi:MAG: molybdopterin cofactor-binding domain-containing protein [Alphaproteobacteria bacterium]